MGGAPLGGLLAGWLTAQGGTKLAFTVAGTSAILVAIAGTAVLLAFKPPTTSNRRRLEMQTTHSYTRCRFGVATRDVDAAGRDLCPLLGRRDARRRRGRPPAVRRDGRGLRADRRRRADPGARRGRPRLVPAPRRTSGAARDGPATHRAGRGRPADQHVAHPRRRERQLAADRQAGRRADRALHRAPDRADRRRDPRGAGGAGAGLGDVRVPAAARWPPTATSGTRRRSASPRGYNPDAPADDTLLVARVTGDAGELRATLFNYACHPTTLAWENRLLSPDYIGAAREVLESAFGAPALFLQGASGELAPRDDYVGDTAVADRNGRQLGHAAAAAIESLPPPATRFVYTGIVASGANLGTWEYQPRDAEQLRASEQLAARAEPRRAAAQGGSRRRRQPLQRDSRLGPGAGEGAAPPLPQRGARRRPGLLRCRSGRGGSARRCWSRCPNEPYSVLQVELRRRFAGTPLLVLGVTNGTIGYLSPEETYGSGRYQEQQSPFAPGCLEQTIEVAARRARRAARQLKRPAARLT